MVDEQQEHSIRNLVDADVGPLRRFTGVFDSMPTEKKKFGEGEKARAYEQISFFYKEIEVLEAVEPYHLPIFSITVNKSNKKKSKYGVIGVSWAEVLDQQYTPEQLDPTNPEYIRPTARMDLKDCFGKRIGLILADGEDGRPAPPMLFDGRANEGKGGDAPTPVWMVYMVEGIGMTGDTGETPLAKAIELLDGKTLPQFNKAALENEQIRADTELLSSISMPPSAPNNFANTMVASKKFTKGKDGVFHKVVEA